MPRFRGFARCIRIISRGYRTQGQKLALANGEIDLGFMIGPFEHPEYESAALTSEVLYAVTPLGHPLLQAGWSHPTCAIKADHR
jgi:DNA-binding transcriptional LysR family regulator